MVERTRSRVAASGLEQRVSVHLLGAQELHHLLGEQFDAVYSNLGVLNCVPDLPQTARACADLVRPGGYAIVSVIGRICPWEIAFYGARGHWGRALVRWRPGAVPVPLQGDTVWTQYYTPGEFYGAFAGDFALIGYRALRLFSPPPYLLGVSMRLRPICSLGEWIDDRIGGWPIVRNGGDHFLMVMQRLG
jgi:SAM-dependent methyltransferase